uniref:SAP domain-containing protein n=1 Tax=Panagrolaimus sp. ES5 TaxID=591445 RepID=A0AC34F777_9BILA
MDEESIRKKYEALTYRDLQKKAKKINIKANGKKEELLNKIVKKLLNNEMDSTCATSVADSSQINDSALEKSSADVSEAFIDSNLRSTSASPTNCLKRNVSPILDNSQLQLTSVAPLDTTYVKEGASEAEDATDDANILSSNTNCDDIKAEKEETSQNSSKDGSKLLPADVENSYVTPEKDESSSNSKEKKLSPNKSLDAIHVEEHVDVIDHNVEYAGDTSPALKPNNPSQYDSPVKNKEDVQNDTNLLPADPKHEFATLEKESNENSLLQKRHYLSPKKSPAAVRQRFNELHQLAAKQMTDIETDQKLKQERQGTLTNGWTQRLNELSKPKNHRFDTPSKKAPESPKKRRSSSVAVGTPISKRACRDGLTYPECTPRIEELARPKTPPRSPSRCRSSSVGRISYKPKCGPYVFIDTTKMTNAEFEKYKKKQSVGNLHF